MKQTCEQMELPFAADPLDLIDHAWIHVVLRSPMLSVNARWDACAILNAAHLQVKRDLGRTRSFPPLHLGWKRKSRCAAS